MLKRRQAVRPKPLFACPASGRLLPVLGMKTLLGGLVAIGLLCAHAAAQTDKVQVSVQKKRAEPAKAPLASSGGVAAKAAEKVIYELKLQNQTLSDLSKITVDYLIFVERHKLGEKMGQEPHVDRVAGSKAIDALSNREPQTVTTDELELNKGSLGGGWSYVGGGKVRVEDNVVGVWVRVSQDGTVIGEYTNPPNVTKRGWDQK